MKIGNLIKIKDNDPWYDNESRLAELLYHVGDQTNAKVCQRCALVRSEVYINIINRLWIVLYRHFNRHDNENR